MPTFILHPHHDFYDITLSEKDFNHWIAVINTVVTDPSSRTNPHRQFILLGIKENMMNYSKFDTSNRSAHIRLDYDEVIALQTAFAELSPRTWNPNVKDSFKDAASDPDSRKWTPPSNDWDEFFSASSFHNNLTEAAVRYLNHWRDLCIPLDIVLLSITFKESAPLYQRQGTCVIDWDRMNNILEKYSNYNPTI